jgi:hypothetical protein
MARIRELNIVNPHGACEQAWPQSLCCLVRRVKSKRSAFRVMVWLEEYRHLTATLASTHV